MLAIYFALQTVSIGILLIVNYNYPYLLCGIYNVAIWFAVILYHMKNVQVQIVQMPTSIETPPLLQRNTWKDATFNYLLIS
jgi:hypothetical protein